MHQRDRVIAHPGSLLEEVDAAARFFADLDPTRFGVMAHLTGETQRLEPWLAAMGTHVQHLYLQLCTADLDPATPAGREQLAPCADALEKHHFRGSATIEFTRDLNRDERIEDIYAHARADLAWCREILH